MTELSPPPDAPAAPAPAGRNPRAWRFGHRPRSVRAALTQLVAAVLVPLAVAGAAFLRGQWEDEREAALARLQSQANGLQVAMDRELALDLAVLQTLASSTAVEREDWAELHAAAVRAAALRPGGVITVFAPDGRNLVNSSRRFGDALPNVFRRPPERAVTWNGREVPLPGRPLFADPFRTGRPTFSGVVWGRVSQRPVVATHLPVLREGQAVLVVGLAYGADTYARLMAATDSVPGQIKAVIDGQGLIVGRHPAHGDFVARRAPHIFERGGAQLEAKGTGRGRSLEGIDVFFAHSRSSINDWTVVVAMPRDRVLARAWQTLWTSVAGLLAAGVLGGVLAARLARRLATPLHRLAEQAARPGLLGDPRARPSGLREVDTLAQALNDAALAQQQRARLEAEREEAREHLRSVNEQLQRADRHKDEFIAMLSHELRNPLAPIRNSLYILDRSDPAGPMGLRARQVIERQVAHMSRLVDDLLDITRMARGRLELRQATVDLVVLVTQIAQDHRDLLSARGLACDLALPAGPLWVQGDATRLAQAIGNLVQNAAKFTEAGGRVGLRVAASTEEARVEVTDTGAGIPRAHLASIFDPFVQGDQDLARTPGGLGLGLAIVRGVVALHGGRVEAFSDGPGRGSRFLIHLPLVKDDVPVVSPSAAADEAAPGPGPAREVLVIEDHPDVAQSLLDVVRLLGHEGRWAPDAGVALSLVRERSPDAILCDIGLPGMDGFELAGALRREGYTDVLIALSGYARPEDVQRALAAGFDAHIAKPADPRRLMDVLRGRGRPSA